MAYQEIVYDVADGVATVTLNRPDKLNAWTSVMENDIRQAMRQASDDEKVRVIVLTGAGRGFCAGADMGRLSSIVSTPGERTSAAAKVAPFDAKARKDFQKKYSYFPTVPKPIIGAINGPCAGLGMVIALYCDIRFAAPEAVFTTAFARRGLIGEHGITWLLPTIVGLPAALDLMLSARKVDAKEALSIGLVNRLAAPGALMADVRAYARELATMVSPRSMRVMKQQVWESRFRTLGEDIDNADIEMQGSFTSEDFREGVSHFVEKRKPAFTGR
jgi:enoyl-CoA hydratase/carnithine racemase